MAFYWKRSHLAWKATQAHACTQPASHAGGSSRAFDKPMADHSFKMALDFFSYLRIKHYLALGELGVHHRCADKKR